MRFIVKRNLGVNELAMNFGTPRFSSAMPRKYENSNFHPVTGVIQSPEFEYGRNFDNFQEPLLNREH